VVNTVATSGEGIFELLVQLQNHRLHYSGDSRIELFCEKIYRIVQQKRMKDFDKNKLIKLLSKKINEPGFNLHRLVKEFYF
jgi:LAO/AO transport system kinase